MEKFCRHCGTKDNLRSNKMGVIYNCCISCYKNIEIPDRIRRTNDALIEKYNVKDLGELRQKRLKESPSAEKEKPIVLCKYCGSDNIVKSVGKKRTVEFPSCEDHWHQYQKEKSEKRNKTNIKLFGNEIPMRNPDVIEKQKKKIRDTFGVDYPMQNKKVLEKRNKTNLKKYGSVCPTNNEHIKDKVKKTCIEKFGVDNPLKSTDIRKKATQTLLNMYGVDSPLKSNKIKQKVIKTNNIKYGANYPTQSERVKNKVRSKKRESYWNTFILLLKNKYIEPAFSKEEYINSDGELTYKCLKCLSEFKSDGTEPQRISCGCSKNRSSYEYDIVNWLKSIGIDNIKTNVLWKDSGKSKFEIDIFLPDYNFGIDFHGLYWHSNINRKNSYHQDKAMFFREKKIDFIQIFENEWLSSNGIIKSIILNKLNLNKRIFARKCELREISDNLYSKFLYENHIQGYAYAKIKIGLFFNKELVSVMGLGKNRFKHNDASIEIIRFANKCGITVVGGFDKLLSYFCKNNFYEKIISFVDLRLFNGGSYIKNGFEMTGITKPNYFYFLPQDPSTIYNRIKFQKHKLYNKIKDYDPTLSESDNMYKNGYLKILDAGSLKMVRINTNI